MVTPYNGAHPSRRPVYRKTAKIIPVLPGDQALGEELSSAVGAALVQEAVAQAAAASCRSVLSQIVFRDDLDTLKRRLDLFLSLGFKQVGRFEEVVDKDELLLEQAHGLNESIGILKIEEDAIW